MKNLLIALALLIAATTVYAQGSMISGKALDHTGSAASFVNVLLMSTTDSTLIRGDITDVDGVYSLLDVADGQYYLMLSLVGYADAYSDVIDVSGSDVMMPSITMRHGVVLDEVTVSTQRPFMEVKADRVIVNVENSAINAGNSALEVLEKSPGVILDRDNNISLRGRQGVLILINGKNQYMTGEQLATMLSTMPADNIQSLEIIANPGAEYDAEGNSGVIDIKLKKSDNMGYNGSMTAGARQGRKTSYNGGINANYRNGSINIYGSLSHSFWAGFQDTEIHRVIPFNGGQTVFDQNAPSDYDGDGQNGHLGIDYSLSEKTTLGALYKLNTGGSLWTLDNETIITGDNAPPFRELNVTSDQESGWTQHSANLNLVHNFSKEGATLSFDADYSTYAGDGYNTYHNEYYTQAVEVQSPFDLRNDNATEIQILAARSDLSLPLSERYNLAMGAKASMVKADNSTLFEALEDGAWTNQLNRSNEFEYDETIYAAYTNVSTTIGEVQIQAGLRLEHTISDGNSVTLDQRVKREYTNLFPSASISHVIGEEHSLSYNYSRRLTRPQYETLNPFISYNDDYTFDMGNPFLTPEYSNSFGVNYGWGNKLFISLDYSHTTEAITEVLEQIVEDNAIFKTNQNLDDFNNFSVNVSAPIIWSDGIVTRVNLSSFYNEFKSVIPSGTLDNAAWAHYLYIGNEVSLPASIMLEVNADYQSPMVYGQFKMRRQYGIDIGLSRPVLHGQGNIKVGVDDILRTRRLGLMVEQEDIDFDLAELRDTRRAKIHFTYHFGNSKVKAARERQTSIDNETNRLSN